MVISIIHPSRNRPERASKVFHQMISNADRPELLEYIISIDEDEIKKEAYHNICGCTAGCFVVVSNNNYCVGAINNGAKESVGEIIMVTSDDFDEWPRGWDSIIRKCFEHGCNETPKPILLKTFDGSQKWIATLPIMNRLLYEQLGYIYNPLYKHMFADTDLSCTCDLMGVTMYRNDIVFRHNHYTKMKNKDATNERNDDTWKEGEDTFIGRWKENFGVTEVKGEITNPNIIGWAKSKV